MSGNAFYTKYLPSGFDPSDIEFHQIKFACDDKVVQLEKFSYGGINLTQIPQPVFINGEFHHGVEFSTFVDYRDGQEGKYLMKVLPSNEVMLTMPSVSRHAIEEFNQIFHPDFDVSSQEARQGVMNGQAVMRAAMKNNPILRIRVIVFKFPEYYKIQNKVFAGMRLEMEVVKKSFSRAPCFYPFNGQQMVCNQVRISWLISKVMAKPITTESRNQSIDPDVESLIRTVNACNVVQPPAAQTASVSEPFTPVPSSFPVKATPVHQQFTPASLLSKSDALPSSSSTQGLSFYTAHNTTADVSIHEPFMSSVARMPSSSSLQSYQSEDIDLMVDTGVHAMVLFDDDKKRKSDTPIKNPSDPFILDNTLQLTNPEQQKPISITERPKKKTNSPDETKRPYTRSQSRTK